MHGLRRGRKPSDFSMQLLEKQRVKYTYWIGEKQLLRYVRKAFSEKGDSGENLLRLLERRLDSVVYRLGFAPTIPAARQMVVHGHISVNKRRVDKPSYGVRPGDVVEVREGSEKLPQVEEGLVRAMSRGSVPYLEGDKEKLRGILKTIPKREEIPLPIDDRLVIEYYARKT